MAYDRRVELSEALLKLLEKKRIEDITVGEIAEKARFSRRTFYNYFTDKYDVLSWHFHQAVDVHGNGKLTDYEIAVLEYLKSHRKSLRNLVNDVSQNGFRNMLAEDYQTRYRRHIYKTVMDEYDEAVIRYAFYLTCSRRIDSLMHHLENASADSLDYSINITKTRPDWVLRDLIPIVFQEHSSNDSLEEDEHI